MRLFRPRTIWWPTWQGWVFLFLLLGGLFLLFLLKVHGFLAVTHRVANADILVVEAWVPDVVLQGAANEFRSGRYRLLLIGDLSPAGQPETARTPRAVGRMEALGVPRDRIVFCSVAGTDEHRSFAMAVAVREALLKGNMAPRGLCVVAPAAHARKTWLAYRRALSSQAPVGVVSVLTEDYDPARWWESSQGAKWVVANGVGWLYELFAGPRS